MSEVSRNLRLNLRELKQIINFVEQNCDPHISVNVIESYFMNGIGSIIDIEVPMVVNGVQGEFRTRITDESDW